MTMDAMGPTKPEAGVIATRPATAPEAAPSTVGLPRLSHSVNIQPSAAAAAPAVGAADAPGAPRPRRGVNPPPGPAAAAPVLVATNALAASPLASSALPALKPNQPNQSSAAPITVIGRVCGGLGGGAEARG